MAVDVSVILTRSDGVMIILLSDEEKEQGLGALEGLIFPDLRFSSRKSSVAFCSLGVWG